MAEQYCLRWNNHQRTLISVFDSLQERGCMVDCTLSAEGRSLQAHKVVLSACSPYLEDLLTKHYDKHPILILKDVKFEELKSMLDYMYRGEVNVAQDRLNTFLKAAESLQIKGLSDGGTDPPDSGGTPGATKRTSKGAPVSVRSEQLTVRTTNLNDNTSRDGSISPSLRKRRRRRGSDASDQESSSVEKQSSATPAAGPLASSDMLPTVPTSGPADASALLSIMENETEPTDSGISIASNQVPLQENVIREKDSETLIEPKSEFLDDDTAQDLPMEDDDMFRAGPSHGRSGNFGGDEDVYMAQDSGANAQGGARSGGRRRGRPRRVPRASSRGGGRSRLLRNPFSLFALPAWYSRDDEDGGADAAEDDGYVLPVEAVLGTSGSKAAETEEGPATDSEVDSDVDAVPLAARLKAKGRKSDGRKVANVSLEDQRDLDRGVGEDRGAVPDGGDLPDLGDHPNHGDLPDRGDDSGHGGRLDVPAGPFRCTECGALLQTLPAIVAHLKTHAGMFACNLCGKTLGCKSSLERHRLVHSQQRPHACELCDARYKHRCHLVEHRKRAH